MKELLRILHLEDDPMDAELVASYLDGAGISCETRVVATRPDFTEALNQEAIDLVLADLALPTFDGLTALAIVREMHPDLPFIFVSGRLGEEAAIESLKSGATDYVLKNRLSRLAPAVTRAMSEAEERAERRKAEIELQKAHLEIKETAERFQNLFTSIRDLIVVTDHHRTILHVNQPALREMFGYEREEVEGKNVRMFYADKESYELSGRGIVALSGSVKAKIFEVDLRRKGGELFSGEQYVMKQFDSKGVQTGNIGIFRDISERKKAEEALRESELRRYQLQLELVYAAEVQAKLLPRSYPQIPGFDVAARCLPAKQVGGDFFDWLEVCAGVWSFTLGDVMGKGMAAAMLMATVRASLRSVAHNRPGEAIRLAEQAILPDLESSESFVTLFHAQLYGEAHRLNFIDCGHGYAFLRHADGAIEELSPRGLPLGVPGSKYYQEGTVELEQGDTLVLYSDGLTDARPELELTNQSLAGNLKGLSNARQMVDRLVSLTEQEGPQPDDITVLVVCCTG